MTMSTSVTDSAPEVESPKPDEGAKGKQTIICYNPATGEQFREIEAASPEDVQPAVSKARNAFKAWRRLSLEERCRYMLDAREKLVEHRDELLELLQTEAGKPAVDAVCELLVIFDTIGYYTSNAKKFLGDETVDLHLLKNKKVKVEYPPIGVCLNISPWNFPLDLSISPVIPALIAGNAAIIKPSENTPLITMRAVELMNEAGFPEGLLQVLPGYGDVGAELCNHADAITFTGSVATGKKVAKAAAENLVPCTLELGGKDPAIVLDDANLERAANGIVWGSFLNSGQICMSIERVYVHEDVHDKFVDMVVQKTLELRQGAPLEERVDVGAMIDPHQIDIVADHLRDAEEKGAEILTGGQRKHGEEGDFFEPTVLVNCDHSMKIMKDETFGPVMPIMKVRSAFEAIQLANDSVFGLNASVWSKDKKRARQIASQIESGQVCINEYVASYLAIEAPYGGVKHSGIGRRKCREEIRKYVEPKTVLEDIFGLDREPYWYPYSDTVDSAVDKVLGLLFRRGIGEKMRELIGGD
jgi:succinate-semialdehyde dehydrogenase/glutarate-semialdehyde dehydrogenase